MYNTLYSNISYQETTPKEACINLYGILTKIDTVDSI